MTECWQETNKTRQWLWDNKATVLHTAWGFTFYENPITGDQSPVLATYTAAAGNGRVYNTQDFDLPTSDPKEKW